MKPEEEDRATAPKPARTALPAVVWGLGLTSLLTDAAADMVVPLLPALIGKLGGGALALGAVEGVAEATSALVKISSGVLVDRGVRPGRLVVFGYGLAALVRPVYAAIVAPWQAAVLRSLDRVGKGVRSAPRDGIIAASVGASQRAYAFGVHRGMDNLGAVVGGLTAFVLLGQLGLSLETVLMLSVVPGVLSTAVAAWVVRGDLRRGAARADAASVEGSTTADGSPKPPAPDASSAGEDASTRKGALRAALPSALRRLLFAIALFGLAGSADSFLLAHLMHQGVALGWIPLAWIGLQLGKSLLNAPGGALADRVGADRAMLASWIVYALAYVGFGFSTSPLVTLLCFGLYAFHYGLGEGAEKAAVAALAPPEQKGRAFGLLAAVSGLMLLPANLLFGALYERGPSLAFFVTAAIAAFSALTLRLLR